MCFKKDEINLLDIIVLYNLTFGLFWKKYMYDSGFSVQ